MPPMLADTRYVKQLARELQAIADILARWAGRAGRSGAGAAHAGLGEVVEEFGEIRRLLRESGAGGAKVREQLREIADHLEAAARAIREL